MIKFSWKTLGIKAKIIASLLPIVVPIVVIIVTNFNTFKNDIVSNNEKLAATIISTRATEINNFLESGVNQFKEWTADDVYGIGIEFDVLDEFRSKFTEMLDKANGFSFLALLNSSGTILVASDPNLSGQHKVDWLQYAGAKPYGIVMTDFHVPGSTGEAPTQFVFTFPAHNSSGTVNGYLYAVLDASHFQEYVHKTVEQLAANDITDAEVSLINLDENLFQASTVPEDIGSELQFEKEALAWLSETLTGTQKTAYKKINQYMAGSALVDIAAGQNIENLSEDSALRLVTTIPEKTILKRVRTVLFMNLAIGLGSLIFVIVIVWYSTGSIVKPIYQIRVMLKDMAQGKGDLTKRLEIQTEDELGELASWFNAFIEKLQEIIRQVIESASKVGRAATDISSAAGEMASGAEEQQAQLSEVATSMEQMSSMILESSNNAGNVNSNMSEANSAVEEGQASVKRTIDGINEVVHIMGEASEQIGALEERSREIGEVIQVIDEIADQTNLLALNANIEAARAGDAGRGFAVVADEVRKLAERTVKATSDISSKITLVQEDVSSAVKAMREIADKARANQDVAAQSGTVLDQVRNISESVGESVMQINAAADQQSTGAEQISRNIEGVSTVSRDAAISSQELATSSEKLNEEVSSLNELLGQFQV